MKNSSPERTKCLIVIQDGVGDLPLTSLGGKTPLEAAATPHMDSLIRRGSAGLIDILGAGIPVGTDIGHLALFGQDTDDRLYRRGPMEAAGIGIELGPSDVALRFNFATVNADGEIIDRRAGRIREETGALVESLNRLRRLDDSVEVCFHAATEHRGVLLLRGEGLSGDISDTDPGKSGTRIRRAFAADNDEAAVRTAELVNQLVGHSRSILENHPANRRRVQTGKPPANIILTRGAGMRREFANLSNRLGVAITCVSGESTVLGIARLAGATVVATAPMTANLDTDLQEKARKTVESLQDSDLVYLHLKGCDIAAHDRQPKLKKWFIEQTDSMIGEILKEIGDWPRLRVAFTGDHSTLSATGEHSGDPVPVFLSGNGIRPDPVVTYGERYCAEGSLGRLLCRDFLEQIFEVFSPRNPEGSW